MTEPIVTPTETQVVPDPDTVEVLVWVYRYAPDQPVSVVSVWDQEHPERSDPRWQTPGGHSQKVPNRGVAAALVRVSIPTTALAPIPIEQIRQWEASQ